MLPLRLTFVPVCVFESQCQLYFSNYWLQLCVLYHFRSQPVTMDNPGKSGAKFYQSYDRLFILKSLTSEEVERMHSFLKDYHPVSFFFPITAIC